jgi:hypothetical protein
MLFHTEFTLFPKLPFDLRIYIWRLAAPLNRVVRIYEEIEFPDSDSEADDSEEDEDGRSIVSLDEKLNSYELFSNHGQSQLEDFGFTSSHPQPELPTDDQQRHAAKLRWETTRVGKFYHEGPIPVLLHVCRESRELLKSYGYALTFSTRTAPAMTWFNYSSDILHLREHDEDEHASPTLDGGMWNIGQFARHDLDRVSKLALSLHSWDYCYGGKVPAAIHKAVQLCRNLKELLIVEIDYHDVTCKDIYWYSWNGGGEIAVVDLSVEELWGHHSGWEPGPWDPRNNYDTYRGRQFEKVFEQHTSSYGDIARDIEDQIRSYGAFFHRKEWITPKVRFVMFIAQNEVAGFERSREAYGRYIDNMYWKRVAEGRKSYRPPSPLQIREGIEAQRESWMEEEPRSLAWYKDAREAIHSVHGWPSPFTMEWIEASEARLDMDSWPWAEE